jgi:hypothetical protein
MHVVLLMLFGAMHLAGAFCGRTAAYTARVSHVQMSRPLVRHLPPVLLQELQELQQPKRQ